MGARWLHTRSAATQRFLPPPADCLLAGGLFVAFEAELYITEHTVKTHVASVLRKLGLRDRVHAVIFAYESALTDRG